jgi:hypothetical protein
MHTPYHGRQRNPPAGAITGDARFRGDAHRSEMSRSRTGDHLSQLVFTAENRYREML